MIAVDAFGGDYAPKQIILGALQAARSGIPVLLVGNESVVINCLEQADPGWKKLPIVLKHSSDLIDMADEPTKAVTRKSDSSLVLTLKAVAQGQASAAVSAGNSGAVLVGSTFHIGRTHGVLRPAVGAFLPTKSSFIFCLDLGTNVDCKPEFLEQFAIMGNVFVQLTKDIKNPRIALLSNGHEAYKGPALVKQSFELLCKLPINFVGNLEARDIFDDKADVLVCDGFAGNVLLKSVQGTARALFSWLDAESKKSWISRLLLMANASLFKTLKHKTDYASRGGALLLGVQAPVVLAHGNSQSNAITNAIKYAHEVVQDKLIERFNHALVERIKNVENYVHSDEKRKSKYENQLFL